jgi:hypothetical protein
MCWLDQKFHRITNRPKGKQQGYFSGVFPEATNTVTAEKNSSDSVNSVKRNTFL